MAPSCDYNLYGYVLTENTGETRNVIVKNTFLDVDDGCEQYHGLRRSSSEPQLACCSSEALPEPEAFNSQTTGSSETTNVSKNDHHLRKELLRKPSLDSHASTADCSRQSVSGSQAADESVIGRVWELSKDAKGCRLVQRAMDEAPNQAAVLQMAMELNDHVWDAMRSPHANFVMQKFIVLLEPIHSGFIIAALIRSKLYGQACRHKYACRIVQHLLQYCLPSQVSELEMAILSDIQQLACHPYGNYVIQHMLEHGTVMQKTAVCNVMLQNYVGLSCDIFGCNVINSALTFASDDDQLRLARLLLDNPSILIHLSCSRHGCKACKAVLNLLQDAEKQRAIEIFTSETDMMHASRYGKLVAAEVELLVQQQ